MKHFARTVALAATVLVPVAAAPQRDVTYVHQGTVRAVQLTTRTVDLITGVGYALRMVHMQVLPTTVITSEGAAVRLGDLAPGDVVRADCRHTDAGLLVDKIEIKRRGP